MLIWDVDIKKKVPREKKERHFQTFSYTQAFRDNDMYKSICEIEKSGGLDVKTWKFKDHFKLHCHYFSDANKKFL